MGLICQGLWCQRTVLTRAKLLRCAGVHGGLRGSALHGGARGAGAGAWQAGEGALIARRRRCLRRRRCPLHGMLPHQFQRSLPPPLLCAGPQLSGTGLPRASHAHLLPQLLLFHLCLQNCSQVRLLLLFMQHLRERGAR